MSDQQHQRRQRGDQIFWTYRDPSFPDLVDQRPVTAIADDDHHFAVWWAADTRMLYQVSTNGQDLRSLSGTDRFTAHAPCLTGIPAHQMCLPTEFTP